MKDYDNYIARLNKIPGVFAQVQQAMDAGVADGRTVPQMLMVKAQAQVATLGSAKPEDSPFAAPLKKMPAGISAADAKRIRTEAMDAITGKVLPSYDRFGRYLKAQYMPQARTTLGATDLPDGQAYYGYPHPPVHHNVAHRGSDPSARPGRGEARRSRDARHRKEARLPAT